LRASSPYGAPFRPVPPPFDPRPAAEDCPRGDYGSAADHSARRRHGWRPDLPLFPARVRMPRVEVD